MEVWKDIKGYEGYYQVSNLGRVKSVNRRVVNHKSGSTRFTEGIILSPCDNGNGYLVVSLRKDGKRKNAYMHRIVAEAFVENRENKPNINHKDYNTKNNVATNLEWCTQKENVAYSVSHMRKPKTVCALSNTGEKYISKRLEHKKNIKYRVTISQIRVDKSFKSIELAIQYRNEVMQKWQNQ